MKKIVLIATGGTIAGIGDKGKTTQYKAGMIPVSQILSDIPDIEDIELEFIDIMNIDSNEMNEEKMLLIRETILNKEADGYVITHGTDTIEETAYFLNLTVNKTQPIVLTGSMRPSNATSADGPFNLFQAICLAKDDSAIGKGVMCLFSSTIYSARDIEKVNNYKVDAFEQRINGALGYMQDDQVHFLSESLHKHTFCSDFTDLSLPLKKVGIACFYAGASSYILDELAKENDGIVIMGTGSRNYSNEWVEKIHELKDKVTFVRASRVTNSIVLDNEDVDERHETIAATTLSPYKARILLMLSLTKNHSFKEIQDNFHHY